MIWYYELLFLIDNGKEKKNRNYTEYHCPSKWSKSLSCKSLIHMLL